MIVKILLWYMCGYVVCYVLCMCFIRLTMQEQWKLKHRAFALIWSLTSFIGAVCVLIVMWSKGLDNNKPAKW